MGDRGYLMPLPSLPLSYRVIFGFGSEMYVCVYLCYMNLGGLSYRVIFDFVQRYMCVCVYLCFVVCPTRISSHISEQNPK
jgi:hypothetical protein